MAAMELDPLFVKALGFLRSKTKESADQLRELLDDLIAGSGKSKLDKPVRKLIPHEKVVLILTRPDPYQYITVPHAQIMAGCHFGSKS